MVVHHTIFSFNLPPPPYLVDFVLSESHSIFFFTCLKLKSCAYVCIFVSWGSYLFALWIFYSFFHSAISFFFNYFGEVDSCSIPLLVVTPLLLLCCWILVDVIITFALKWLLLLLKHVIEVLCVIGWLPCLSRGWLFL